MNLSAMHFSKHCPLRCIGVTLVRLASLILLIGLFALSGLSEFGGRKCTVAAFPTKLSSNGPSSTKKSNPNFGIRTSRNSWHRAVSIDLEEETKQNEANTDSYDDSWTNTMSKRIQPLQLHHEGTRLQLSVEKTFNHRPIVILDGLPTSTWTMTVPMTRESTAAAPTSFSSVALQTKIPSVPIESLPLGNFMVSSGTSETKSEKYPHKYLAAARLNRYWMGPKFGDFRTDTTNDNIPVDTQFLLVEIERDNESTSPCYALMMPLVDGGFRSTLESTSDSIFENGEDGMEEKGQQLTLVSYSESGDNIPKTSKANKRNAMYVAVHDDPYELLQMGFRQVSEILDGSFKTLDQKQIPKEFVNSFGWCSWDAFYSKVHPSGILKGVKCLSDAGVPVKNVIVDDGWQQVSPPYLHQQEDDNTKKRSLAASLSLSGSSDVMPESDVLNDDEFGSKATTESEESSKPSLLSTIASSLSRPLDTLSKIGGSLFGIVATGVTNCYQKYVENASFKSFPKRLWTFLARNSPLNYGLWKFFDSETDFGRQLNDPYPNWKFLGEEQERENLSTSNMALKDLVAALKDDLMVKRVYCWHSIHGYWRGVSDDFGQKIGVDVTQIKTRPSDHLLRLEPEMAFDPPSLFGVGLIGKRGDLGKFYQRLHDPLVAAGIDGVKVDVQSGITAAGMRGNGFEDCPPLAKYYTQAMEESVSKRFPSSTKNSDSASKAVECINCMCHSTENLYRYKTTSVARASDDFYPARPESHSVHLVNVAYNSLFLGEICLPDWDMFHSQHKSAELHAAARAIGGCSVYVSDAPGNHNVPLLKKLVLPDGSVLRAQKPGRPTRDCIFVDVGRDGKSALKIWNVNRSPEDSGCGGIVGAFNVQGVAWNFESNENEILVDAPPAVRAEVKPHDVESLRHVEGQFAVWSHRTQSISLLDNGRAKVETKLTDREWELFTIQPVQEDTEHGIQWAPIGLGAMLNSGGAIVDVGPIIATDEPRVGGNSTSWSKERQATFASRGPGNFVAYCQPRPSYVSIRNGMESKPLDFDHDQGSGLLEFNLPQESIEGRAHDVTVVWEV